MSKPRTPAPEKKSVTKAACVQAIMSCVLAVLPLTEPESRLEVVEEVTGELEALKPLIIPVKGERKRA